MRKFHCLLFVLKRSHICYYIICMTVPLTNLQNSQRKHLCQSLFFNKVGGWKPKTVRSSLWKCSVKKGALKNFMWKHLCWSLFLITLRLVGPQNRSILCSYGNQVETSLLSCGDILYRFRHSNS